MPSPASTSRAEPEAPNPNSKENTGNTSVLKETIDDSSQSYRQNATMQATKQSSQLQCLPEYIGKEPSGDDDSVSTLGSDVPVLKNASSSRSIFRDYWSVDEKASAFPSRKYSLDTLDTELCTLDKYAESMRNCPEWSSYINEEVLNRRHSDPRSHCGDPYGYEAYLKMNEAGRTALPSAALLNDGNIRASAVPANPLASVSQAPVRRKLFSRRYGPTPSSSLPSYGYMYLNPRKGRAPLPFLLHNKKMLRSSLRSQSLSESTTLGESLPSSESRPSVSFGMKVTVHEYDKPHQQYITDGWSKRFA